VQIFDLGDINGRGLYTDAGAQEAPAPSGNFVAFAIGPDSLVDEIRLDSRILKAGRILPLRSTDPTVSPVRSARNTDDGFCLRTNQVNQRTQIIGFECGDAVVNPGARAPWRSAWTPVVVAAAMTRIARIPAQGRSQFRCSIQPVGALSLAAKALEAYGYNYVPRDLLLATPIQDPMATELVVTTIPANTGTASLITAIKAATFYIGGTNDGESYDEIEVWLNAGGAGTVFVMTEAYDAAGNGGSL
jgi:hypothetical protein